MILRKTESTVGLKFLIYTVLRLLELLLEAGLGRGGGAAVGGGGAVVEGEELDSVVGGVAVVVVLEGSEARGSMPVLYLPWLRNMVKLKFCASRSE